MSTAQNTFHNRRRRRTCFTHVMRSCRPLSELATSEKVDVAQIQKPNAQCIIKPNRWTTHVHREGRRHCNIPSPKIRVSTDIHAEVQGWFSQAASKPTCMRTGWSCNHRWTSLSWYSQMPKNCTMFGCLSFVIMIASFTI